jgi:hypothetical protein
MAITLATSARNAACDAIVDRLDLGSGAGTIQIRSGTRPATPNDTATGTLLATVTLADPAFGAAATGVATLTDPASVTGAAAGTATWFRALDSDSNAVFDGSITATGGGGDLTLNTTTISVGLTVDITGGTITMPSGG